VARQKDNESDEVSWGEFLRVVLIGEYSVTSRARVAGRVVIIASE